MKPSGTMEDYAVSWLGHIPTHWVMKKFSHAILIAEGQVDPEDERYANTLLVAPNHIEPGTGRLVACETVADQGAISGKYLCEKDDVIYSKIRPALRKATLAPAQCLCSADMYPMRPRAGLDPKFLLLLLLSAPFTAWATLESDRVAMPKVNRESLSGLRIPVPPLAEQRAIADYLDRETARIDALIAAKERVLELLAEKRRALITRAVTRGLDPHAPLRDSGIPWLGEIPAHWRALPIKYGFARIGSGTTPPAGTAEYYDGDTPWVTTSELRENTVYRTSQSVTTLAMREFTALRLYLPGSILFAMYGATIGRVAMLAVEATVNQAVCVMADEKEWLPSFVFYSLQASRDALITEASGGGQPNVNAEKVKNHRLACPPPAEQKAIVVQIDRMANKIATLAASTTRTVALLKERRAALIAAAVTGQIDLGGVA